VKRGGVGIAICLVALVAVPETSVAMDDALSTLLARAGEYAVRYEASLPAIVAEETYEQRYFTPHEPRPTQTRVLRSDVLIVRLPLDVRWLMYRAVFSVDGREIPDQKGRLEQIFRESPANALEKAQELLKESARFNIGPVERNFNVPTLALVFLLPDNQARVRFALSGTERGDGRTWAVLRAAETGRPTLLRSNGIDTPLDLTYWIDAESGAVGRAELRFTTRSGGSRVHLVAKFAWNARSQVRLPSEMTERYDLRTSAESLEAGYYVEGSAKYGNVRRFEVKTEDEYRVP